jgi:hypothetical protein
MKKGWLLAVFTWAALSWTAAAVRAQTESSGSRVPIYDLQNTVFLSSLPVTLAQDGVYAPFSSFAFRAGAMVSPRGAGLAGVDASIPSFSFGSGLTGRLDVDVIFKANFAGINTIVPVTINQVYYSNPTPTGQVGYLGGGAGFVFGGKMRFTGKMLVGFEFNRRLGAEANVFLNSEDTIVSVLGRLKL